MLISVIVKVLLDEFRYNFVSFGNPVVVRLPMGIDIVKILFIKPFKSCDVFVEEYSIAEIAIGLL